MANLAALFQQMIDDAATRAPGALQSAEEGDRRAADLQRQRLDEGEGFLRNYDKGRINLPLLQGFGAMMGPTRTGSFGESLSNAISAGGGALARQRQEEMDRFDKLQRIQEGRAKLAQAEGLMGMEGLNRRFGLIGNFGGAQDVLRGVQIDSVLGGLNGGGTSPTMPEAPASPLGGIVDQQVPAAAPAAPTSPFGQLPKRLGQFPAEHGAVTSTPPEMNTPPGPVMEWGQPVQPASAPAAAPAPGSSAQSPAPRPAVVAQAPASAPGAAEGETYQGEVLPPGVAEQLEKAYQVKRALAPYADNPRASSALAQADSVINKFVKDDFVYDPASKRLVPTGKASIAYQERLASAKQRERETPEEAARKTAATEFVKSKSKTAENYGASQKYLSDADMLLELSRAAPEGTVGKFKAWLFEKTGKAYGEDAPAMEAFLSATKQLLPGMLADMKPVSDTDMKVMASASGQIGNSREAREVIFGMLRAKAEYDVEMSKIARQVVTGQITPAEAAAKEDALGSPKEYLEKVRRTPAYQQILAQVEKKGTPGAAKTVAKSAPASSQGALQPGRYRWDPQKGVVPQ